MSTQTSTPPDLAAMLRHWVAAGYITDDQADRIRADATSRPEPTALPAPPPARGTSLVTEALGYLGGVIVLVGLGLVTGLFWNELSTLARVLLAAAVTALLGVAGAAVPRELAATGVRLRSVLWAVAAAALFACLSLLAADGFGWSANVVVLFAGAGTAVGSALAWMVHRQVLQQAAVLASLLATAAAATSLVADSYLAPMTVIWAVAALWFLLAGRGLVQPRRAGMVFGAVAAIVASLSIQSEAWGTAVSLATVVTLVVVAVAIRDLVLLAVASVGALAVLPSIVVEYFPGVLSAALTLVVVGLLLVAAAVYTARRRPRRPAAPTG